MMKSYTDSIRAVARRLLDAGEVEAFIGYRKGGAPMVNRPTLIRDAGEADALIWDCHCALNLANYVRGHKGKIAVLATGCNSRNLIQHLEERQISRDRIHVVGVPCTGMADHRAIRRAVGGREILAVDEIDGGETLVVYGRDFEEHIRKADVLQSNCRDCKHPNPMISDELVAEPVPEPDVRADCKRADEVEAMDAPERWAHFQNVFDACIRCYACRNACPLCYCPTCFVDENRPQWVGKSVDKTDTLTFHLLRAFHMAGRCTDCGACERVCPMDIPLTYLTAKLNREALEHYGYEAGTDPDDRPLLDKYKLTDLNDFIR